MDSKPKSAIIDTKTLAALPSITDIWIASYDQNKIEWEYKFGFRVPLRVGDGSQMVFYVFDRTDNYLTLRDLFYAFHHQAFSILNKFLKEQNEAPNNATATHIAHLKAIMEHLLECYIKVSSTHPDTCCPHPPIEAWKSMKPEELEL